MERGCRQLVLYLMDPLPRFARNPLLITGNLTDSEQVSEACSGITHIYHIAALVGPYFPKPLYYDVNYQGTLNMLEGGENGRGGGEGRKGCRRLSEQETQRPLYTHILSPPHVRFSPPLLSS